VTGRLVLMTVADAAVMVNRTPSRVHAWATRGLIRKYAGYVDRGEVLAALAASEAAARDARVRGARQAARVRGCGAR
jgi:hypothetical protein